MNRLLRVFAPAFLAFLLVSASNRLEPTPAPNFEERLQEAVAAGRIDDAHATLYRLFALKTPERLPAELRSDVPVGEAAARSAASGGAGTRIHRCATSQLRSIRAGLADLPADLRAEALALLDPPQAREPTSRTPAAKTVTYKQLANSVTTEHFSIEWGSKLTNEDGSKPVNDLDSNGIPDVIELWAAYFEAVYAEEVVKPGFDALTDAFATHLVQVFIGNTDSSVSFENIGNSFANFTYGFTDSRSSVPYIVVNNTFTPAPGNSEGDQGTPGGIHGAMKVTAAHEFFHVIQFLIMPADSPAGVWNGVQDDWWLEASATWVEDEVFDQVNDYWQYFDASGGWASFADQSLAVTRAGYDAEPSRAYGAAIFGKYLSEHVGGRDGVFSVWRDYIAPGPGMRPLVALNAFATGSGLGGGLDQLFLGFAAANVTMDYREGAHYGAVTSRSTSTLTASAPPTPAYLGATYLRRTGAQDGSGLTVNLTGAPASSWGLASSLRRGTTYTLALGTTSNEGTPSLDVSSLSDGDTLYGIPAYLTSGASSTGYSSVEVAGASSPEAPGALTGLVATTAAAGLDLSWTAVAGAAGYVVRWRPSGGTDSWRTVFGRDVNHVELRGLTASTSHAVEVFAYGSTGQEGTSDSVAQTTGAASPTATPTPAMVLHKTPPTDDGGGGGGGGGGGCFIATLGF